MLRKVPSGVVLAGPVQKMPRWLRQPLVHAYGRDAVAAIEAVQARAPPLDLTVKGGVRPEGVVLPTGTVRLAGGAGVGAAGLCRRAIGGCRMPAAAMAVRLLGDVRGQRVLDLCAAPGGKTMQLAAAGAAVTAVDISGPRMQRVRDNLARTGLQADLVVADALHWEPEVLFDAVLLDAPCSATGTIRRHPDLIFVKDGTEIAGLVALQAALFDRALAMLKPGGRLVYCTCSLLPEEGEAQLVAALARHPGLRWCRRLCRGCREAWWARGRVAAEARLLGRTRAEWTGSSWLA